MLPLQRVNNYVKASVYVLGRRQIEFFQTFDDQDPMSINIAVSMLMKRTTAVLRHDTVVRCAVWREVPWSRLLQQFPTIGLDAPDDTPILH